MAHGALLFSVGADHSAFAFSLCCQGCSLTVEGRACPWANLKLWLRAVVCHMVEGGVVLTVVVLSKVLLQLTYVAPQVCKAAMQRPLES